MVFDTEKNPEANDGHAAPIHRTEMLHSKESQAGETCHGRALPRKHATGNVAHTCLAPWEAVSFDLASVEEGTSSRVTGIALCVWVGSEGRVLFFWADF